MCDVRVPRPVREAQLDPIGQHVIIVLNTPPKDPHFTSPTTLSCLTTYGVDQLHSAYYQRNADRPQTG